MGDERNCTQEDRSKQKSVVLYMPLKDREKNERHFSWCLKACGKTLQLLVTWERTTKTCRKVIENAL